MSGDHLYILTRGQSFIFSEQDPLLPLSRRTIKIADSGSAVISVSLHELGSLQV